jgi:DNA-binding beta-propeller fold protein YncE
MTIALSLASSMLGARAEPLIYATGGAGTDLLAVDAKTGETKVIGSFGYPGSAPLAFGSDGKLYTVTVSMRHENSRSQLATVDPSTGKATPIGEPLDKTVRIMALGPGPDGGLYASGVMENRLYRIDPQTGVFTEIGPFKGGRDVMDFATNPKDGAMYATTTTVLYRLEPTSAELTEVRATPTCRQA